MLFLEISLSDFSTRDAAGSEKFDVWEPLRAPVLAMTTLLGDFCEITLSPHCGHWRTFVANSFGIASDLAPLPPLRVYRSSAHTFAAVLAIIAAASVHPLSYTRSAWRAIGL